MTTNQKITLGILIVIAIAFLLPMAMNYDSEERYCKNHPEDCECSITCDEWVYDKDLSVYQNDKNFFDNCMIESSCYEYQKKNPCQLKLEKEGILGEDCICEEWKEKINPEWFEKCCVRKGAWVMCYDADEKYYYEIDKINIEECNKVEKNIKDCIKARKMNDFELNPDKFICNIWELCYKEESDYTGCFEVYNEVDGRYYRTDSTNSYVIGRNFLKFDRRCVDWHKKSIEDLSCSELEKAFECNDRGIFYYLSKECSYSKKFFMGLSLNNNKEEILFQMIKKGCNN